MSDEDRWFDWSVPVGIAIWIAGLAIGLTVSENWISRGDYALVVGIAATWTPIVVLLLRRFRSRHLFGQLFGMLGAWLAPVIPLSRALPETWSNVGRSSAVALAAMCVHLVVATAVWRKSPTSSAPRIDAI